MKTKLKTMLELQDSFNVKVNPNWKTANYPFDDAIFTEATEAYGHTGWEWWKKSELDLGQIKLELTDIWHFLLSEVMLYTPNDKELSHVDFIELIYTENIKAKTDDKKELKVEVLRQALKVIIMYALTPRDNNRIVYLVSAFVKAMQVLDMNMTELYKLYIGKNTLNVFRRNNGYKEDPKKYREHWSQVENKGFEDNQFLTQFLRNADANGPLTAFQLSITNELQHLYNKVKVV